MNRLKGNIEDIKIEGSLSLVSLNCGGTILKSIVIETPTSAPYLKIGNTVQLIFKETEVVITKDTELNISMQNKLKGKITTIENSKLLSEITFTSVKEELSAIITSDAVFQLQLSVGDEITALIKTNEIMLSSC